MDIKINQIKAARSLLGWKQSDLADHAGVSKDTVLNIERGRSIPQTDTYKKIIQAIEFAGVSFTEKGGVEPANNLVTVLEGENVNKQILNDIYYTMKDTGGEVLIVGLSEVSKSNTEHYEFVKSHINRLIKAGITERILIEKGDKNIIAPNHWYRYLPKGKFYNTPFQLYNNRVVMKELGITQKMIVIQHKRFYQILKNMFDLVWEHAEPISEQKVN